MAVKIIHKENGREVRFGSRQAAEEYVELHGGGLAKWEFTVVPSRDPAWGLPAAVFAAGRSRPPYDAG